MGIRYLFVKAYGLILLRELDWMSDGLLIYQIHRSTESDDNVDSKMRNRLVISGLIFFILSFIGNILAFLKNRRLMFEVHDYMFKIFAKCITESNPSMISPVNNSGILDDNDERNDVRDNSIVVLDVPEQVCASSPVSTGIGPNTLSTSISSEFKGRLGVQEMGILGTTISDDVTEDITSRGDYFNQFQDKIRLTYKEFGEHRITLAIDKLLRKTYRYNTLTMVPGFSLFIWPIAETSYAPLIISFLKNGRAAFIFLEDVPQLIIVAFYLVESGTNEIKDVGIITAISLTTSILAVLYVLMSLLKNWMAKGSVFIQPVSGYYFRSQELYIGNWRIDNASPSLLVEDLDRDTIMEIVRFRGLDDTFTIKLLRKDDSPN